MKQDARSLVDDPADLATQRCRRLDQLRALSEAEIARGLDRMVAWTRSGGEILRTYAFRDWEETIGFVNAVAWMARRQDHHPDLEVGYNRCTVRWSTHSVNGLSENDFICAARTDALHAGR